MSRRQMSLEQTLEQERRDILEALGEGSTSLQFRASRSSYSPATTRHGSMQLDHHTHFPAPGTSFPPRHGSIAGIGVGITPPAQPYSAEMNSGSNTASASATTTANDNHGPSLNRRSWAGPVLSSSLRLGSFSLSAKGLHENGGGGGDDDPETTVSAASAPPRRSVDGTDRFKPFSGTGGRMAASAGAGAGASVSSPAMSAASSPTQQQQQQPEKQGKRPKSVMMSGFDLKGLPGFSRGRDSSVRRSTSRGSSLDSRVPSRLARSMSPRNHWLQSSPLSPATSPLKSSNKPITEKGKVIGMDSASKQLSDAALAKLPGSTKPGSRRGSIDGGGSTTSAGDERLEKDVYDSENNTLSESSDDEEFDDESSSSDGESIRGRKVSIEVLPPSEDAAASDGDATDAASDGEAKKEDENKAEETPEITPDSAPDSTSESTTENAQTSSPPENQPPKPTVIHSAKRGPQFLNEPAPPKPPKPQVHPRTSYEAGSAANTPFGSEDEAELSDIKRAQKLSIQMSSTNNSVHNRSIRTIVRGDYANVMEETGGGRRRRRKYVVTTDLSEESVYALEWTIGTILRDGDTLFAVCAMYEENATGPSMQGGESAKAMEDSARIVGSQTEETAQKSSHINDTSYLPRALLGRFGQGTDSKNSSVDSRALSKAESDRARAVETISQTCVRLLRKTLLQVRIAVEIIHCKSPKHIITEAIDKLEPTLVIVGARGRSALKGVLLGSFSNYLVTHSSVPVMVARRKLKKQTKKNKTRIRLSNNLTTPKSLALAKVD